MNPARKLNPFQANTIEHKPASAAYRYTGVLSVTKARVAVN
jgi:hypothetical protein